MDYDFSKYLEVDFNGTSVSEVYLDDALVWSKPKILDFTFNGDTITKYTGTSSNIVVPSSYSILETDGGKKYYVEGNDVKVKKIGERAFWDNSNLDKVTISEGIEEIVNSAFDASSIKTAVLPSTMKIIGEKAFLSSDLNSINFPSGLTTIGYRAFYYCPLTSVTLPNTVTTIGQGAFESCDKLTSVTLPNKLTSINEYTFMGCLSLTSITIPSSVTQLKTQCFYNCSKLATVTMSATPTSIGQQAFYGANLSSLSSYMYNCSSLGSGCFAFKNPWDLTITDESVASRLVATSYNDSNVYGKVYGGAIMGGGARKTGGSDSSGGRSTAYYRVGNHESGITIYMDDDVYLSPVYYHVQTSTTNLWIGYTSINKGFYNDSGGGGLYMGTSMNDRSNSSAREDLTAGTLKKRYLNFGIVTTCLVEGTLITLANGTYKPVEDLNYNDLLRVWNLETGKFDIQYPLAIVKGEQHGVKYRLTIEDGTYLEICGQHDIFDPIAHMFRTYGEGAIYKIEDDLDYYVMKDNGTNSYTSSKITSIELIEEDVTAYGIITSGIITSFANDMMIGLGVLNLVPITEENKFDKVFETLKESCYTYDRLVEEIYSDVEKDLAIGLNLLMTDIYHKDASGLPNLVAPFRNRKPLPNYKGKKLHYLALDDGELTTIRSFENEITVLPEIKTPGKTKWYIVGEYKYLEPGDTYITKFSTVIKAV